MVQVALSSSVQSAELADEKANTVVADMANCANVAAPIDVATPVGVAHTAPVLVLPPVVVQNSRH